MSHKKPNHRSSPPDHGLARFARTAHAFVAATKNFAEAIVAALGEECGPTDIPSGYPEEGEDGGAVKGDERKQWTPTSHTNWLENRPTGLHPGTARKLWEAAVKLDTFCRRDLQERSRVGIGPTKRFLKFAEEEGRLATNRKARRCRQEAIIYSVAKKLVRGRTKKARNRPTAIS